MIVTVTLNPTVDEEYIVPEFALGGWFRATTTNRSPGGKGVNVSRMLAQLGYESAAMGFLAGFNGDYIRDVLRREKITTNFVHVNGETRTNVYIVDEVGHVETGISEPGPRIPEDALKRFIVNYKRMLNRASMVIIGGSLPLGVSMDIYRDLVMLAKEADVPTFIDAAGPAFMAGIEPGPFFAKLDHRFMSRMSGVSLTSLDNLIKAVSDMHDRRVQWAAASYHVSGDVFFTPRGIYLATVGGRRDIISLFGSGDALMSGLIVGFREKMEVEDIIRFAMACAMEEASHLGKGIRGRDAVEKLLPMVNLEKIS